VEEESSSLNRKANVQVLGVNI